MKTVREIRDEANALYQKSSHYIAETFIAIGAIVAIAKGLLDVIGIEIGLDTLFVLSMLFSPLELGMIRAALLSNDHRAKEVKTGEFTLMGLKEYPKVCLPFIGKTVIIYGIQAVVLAFFVFLSTGGFSYVLPFFKTVLSGNIDNILQIENFVLTSGLLGGLVLTFIAGFIAEAYYCLSYYFVVEENMGLRASLSASAKLMKGNIAKYIGIKVCYIIPTAVATVVVSLITTAFTTLFAQLLSIIPSVPLIVFNIILVIITSAISALVSVMLYKVKETLAITIFYKDLRENQE